MRYTSVLFLLALSGCAGSADKEDTAGTGDTGDTGVDYEEGCITVDGGGGYASLADAITLAPEGGVIELCAGTYEEAVTIEKAGVTIKGGGATLSAPQSDVPLTIVAANVTVEDLVVEAPRTAIKLDGATDVTLANVTVAAAGSWGVNAKDATGTITGLTVTEPGAGGVQVSGGALAFTDLAIDYPASFGLEISDDADVTLTNATITGALMLSTDVSDGHAVFVDGASLTMSDSAIVGADGMGFYTMDADVVLTGTTVTDAVYMGIYSFDSTWDITGLTTSGSVLQGVYASGPSFSITDSTISGDSELSCSYSYDEWGTDTVGPWCGGLLVFADTASFSNVTVTGWNNFGIYTIPYEADATALTVEGGLIYGVGRWGAYFSSAEGTVSGLGVTNLREPELTSDLLCGYVDRSVGLLTVYSDLAVDGLVLSDNAGWGYTNLVGNADVTGSTFDGNACWGFANYQSTATVTGSTFTNGSYNGSVYEQEGVLVLDGNTFTTNKTGAVYEYDYGTYISRSEYSGGQGTDLTAFSSGSVHVTNNTFSAGDASLTFQTVTEAVVTGNSWTDYEGSLAYFYAPSTPAVFADNTADDIVGPVVQASQGEAEISNVTVGTTRMSALVEYAYYEDDELIYSYSSQSSNPVFYAYGYYYDDGAGTITDMPGALSIQDVTVTSAYSSLLYASDAELDVSGLTAGTVGENVVYGYWDSYGPNVEIEGLSVGAVDSQALYFVNYSLDYGAIALSDVDIASSTGTGLYASAIGRIDLTDVDLGDASGYGVQTVARSNKSEYVYDAESGSYSWVYTDLDAATAVNATNLTIASASSDALSFQGGSASLSGLTVGASSGDGVSAQGLTAFTVSDATITAPLGMGITSNDTYSFYLYEGGAYETIDADTVATIDGVTVTDAGSTAFAFAGGTATLTGNTATGSNSSGLQLIGVTADVRDNAFTGNDAYGMTCDGATFTTCATNDLADNALGEHEACSDTCAE